ENSTTLKGSKLQSAEILEKDRCSVLGENHDIAEVLQRSNETDSPYDVTLFSSIDNAPASVGIVSLDRGRYLREGNVVLSKLRGVGDELKLRRFAPEVCHVGDASDLLKSGNNHPLLKFAEFSLV